MSVKKRGMNMQTSLLLLTGMMAAALLISTSILLAVGMIPSMVAVFIDRSSEKTRGITVSAMNLAGCAPFIMRLWAMDNSINQSIGMITDPRTIIVMYSAAGIGYVLDWAISGLVATVMLKVSSARIQQIAKRRAELIERWGREVTGEIPVDNQGFAIETPGADAEKSLPPRKS